MQRIRTLSLVLASALALTAWAAQQTHNLATRVAVGEVRAYTMTVEATIGAQSFTVRSNVVDRVTEVDDDGYRVESTQSNGIVEIGDRSTPLPPAPANTIRYTKLGEIAEISGADVNENAYRLSSVSTLVLPEAPVAVGDTWSHTYTAKENGVRAAKLSAELAAIEDLEGKQSARVDWSFEENDGETPVTATGSTWLDLADGTVLRMQADVKNAPIDGAPGPVELKMTMERTQEQPDEN